MAELRESIQSLVDRALDNAIVSYFEDGLMTDAETIALDLVMFDSDLEDFKPAQLTDAVRVWQLKKLGEGR